MIRKTGKGWVLYSRDGSKKLGGPYKEKAQAVKREKQVKRFKHIKAGKR